MCLQLFVVPAVAKRISAERLSNVSGLRVRKLNEPLKGALCFSVDGGCSCSLLSKGAKLEEPVWSLETTVLEGLVTAVTLLAKEADGLAFHAYSVGEDPETRAHVRLQDLVQDIQTNRVKNKHVYLVGKARSNSALHRTRTRKLLGRERYTSSRAGPRR